MPPKLKVKLPSKEEKEKVRLRVQRHRKKMKEKLLDSNLDRIETLARKEQNEKAKL